MKINYSGLIAEEQCMKASSRNADEPVAHINVVQSLIDRLNVSEVEVERLRGLLNRSLYAYYYEKSEHELRKTMRSISKEYEQLDQISATLNPTDK